MSEEARKMHALQDMTRMEGWKIVEEYMTGHIEEQKDRLLTCDMDKVPERRGAVKALRGVFAFINDTIEKGIEENESID